VITSDVSALIPASHQSESLRRCTATPICDVEK